MLVTTPKYPSEYLVMSRNTGARVECRSDGDYAGRPLAIHWQGRRETVKIVLASWRTPEGKSFRVVTQADNVLECIFSETKDEWTVVDR